ncbi:MAG: SDR family NAD(P)-dependent oxidoreductase [Paludibacterium sp.]|uniref:SDR family NAD(P)-dependent oxidoreductase n=1 Tax=Paludibacterium sp. TaxID=1917523 RepID=UPI0025DB6C5B|nr:SDR family NAD(P)-dependent oxidoreductase [Paludibacterium sp.]MBV8047628.1 SDR family NAD(P)-dependent oxidoreductase [Paludibacterium sp.]MBV8648016.1 SDR family NAD(P)-dependent oxidoreductase [Paludibacterium sp.]
MRVLVTGAAGFIGRAVCEALLDTGQYSVWAVDNLSDYYDVSLKQARLSTLAGREGFFFQQMDIADAAALENLFKAEEIDYVIHLAAQAGVRYSLAHPQAFAQTNLLGMANLLDLCHRYAVKHLLFASSSSVYGQNGKLPFAEDDRTDYPVSFYAATKKAGEIMAYSYAHMHRLPITAMRFFTVYGPWGRPDTAPWLFTESIINGNEVKIFNNGDLQRDFIYIDDLVAGILQVMRHVPDTAVPFALFNIGNNNPIKLMDFIQCIEKACGRKANKVYLPMQEGDVPVTYADTSRLGAVTGFSPTTSLEEGMRRFVSWYREFHHL